MCRFWFFWNRTRYDFRAIVEVGQTITSGCDRSTRSCVRGRRRRFDLLTAEKWREFSAGKSSFRLERNDLHSFSTAKERLLFVSESPNFDRPHVWAYVSAIWRAILTAVPPFEAQRRDLFNGVFIVVVEFLLRYCHLKARVGFFEVVRISVWKLTLSELVESRLKMPGRHSNLRKSAT